MKTVLILHGIEGYAGIHWQKWLHDELGKKGYKIIMPDLPNPNKPDRKTWLNIVVELVKRINPHDLIIVGHSLGVVTALDLIERMDNKIGMLVSVSGFSEDCRAELNSYFMKEKIINLKKLKSLINKSIVIYGDNDPYVPQKLLAKLAEGLGVKPVIIKNGGHLNTASGYTKFTQLLNFFTIH